MERLTKTYSDGSFGVADNIPCGENSYTFKDLFVKKLGEYEDLEEHGRLLKLPCKDGDIIYSVVQDGLTIVELRFSLGFYARRGNDIGKTVFLTKSEAEAKLKELQGEVSDFENFDARR